MTIYKDDLTQKVWSVCNKIDLGATSSSKSIQKVYLKNNFIFSLFLFFLLFLEDDLIF